MSPRSNSSSKSFGSSISVIPPSPVSPRSSLASVNEDEDEFNDCHDGKKNAKTNIDLHVNQNTNDFQTAISIFNLTHPQHNHRFSLSQENSPSNSQNASHQLRLRKNSNLLSLAAQAEKRKAVHFVGTSNEFNECEGENEGEKSWD